MKNQTKRSDLQLIYSAKEKKRRRWLWVSGIACFVIAVIAASSGQYVPLLAILFFVCENRDRVFPDETGLSGSISVGICASVFYAQSASYSSVILICVAGGIYISHLRSRSWLKIGVNSLSFSAAGLLAVLIGQMTLTQKDFFGFIFLSLVFMVLAYWIVNSVVISVAVSLSSRSNYFKTVKDLVRSDLTMLWFGFAGALCGLVMLEVNPEVGILALLAVLVVLDVFVISMPVGLAALRQNWLLLFVRATATVVAAGVGLIVVNAIGVSALGISIGLLAASFAALAIVTLAITVRLWFSPHAQGRPDPTLIGGIVLVEAGIPLLGGALGVLGAVAGVAAVIVAAAIAAIMISLGVAGLRRKPQPEPIDSEEVLGAVMLAMFDGLPDLSQHH